MTSIETPHPAKSRGGGQLALAVVGVLLLGLPLLAPAVFALGSLGRGHFNFDFLLPFEAFPATLGGIAALVVAASWSRRHRALTWWTVGVALGLATIAMLWAPLSGIANETDVAKNDPRLIGMLVLLGLDYAALLVVLGVGLRLTVELAKARQR